MAHYVISAEQKAELGRVAVIYGGLSSERPVSLKSGTAVLNALTRAGVDAFGIDLGGEDGKAQPFKQLTDAPMDRAFLALHGPGGEDGTIQGALEMLGIPYTGSGVAASALAMDKLRCKRLWAGEGLPTPDFAAVNNADQLNALEARLGWPMIIKPAHEGSSIGIAKVRNAQELKAAFEVAAGLDRCVLAEKCMTGDEFTVTVIDGKALPVIKLVTPNDFYDFSAKYESNDTQYLFEHGLAEEAEAALKLLCEQAFESVGCSGWARVDVMQDENGDFQLLEINTAPGMTDHSLVPMSAKQAGLSFEQLVVKIITMTTVEKGQ
ncbi:MAG: D-alanine--D-alanine ligase [Pontibacterium sp.]